MSDDALTCVRCGNPMRVTWRGLVLRCHCAASADTHAKRGDSTQIEAPSPMSGAVGEAETPEPSSNPGEANG